MTSVRGRLVAVLVPGLLAVLVAGGASVFAIARAALGRELDAGLRARAEALAALVTLDEGRLDFEFENGAAAPLDGRFEYRTATGRVLRRSPGWAGVSRELSFARGGAFAFGNVDLPGSGRARAVAHRFRPRVDEPVAGASEAPLLVVVAAVDRGPVDEALGALVAALLLAGGVTAVVAAGLIEVGVRWGLAPLERLSRRVGRVGEGTLSRRFDAGGAPKELVPIHRELNALLDRVERTIERERAFADAAAHELRTPLSELRAVVEVALRRPEDASVRTALREALDVGREMERLVESLLVISRGGVGAGKGSSARVAPVVRGRLERRSADVKAKALRVETRLDEGAAWPAPVEAVDLVVRNLLDNAIDHTPPGGRVEIVTTKEGADGGVFVIESGPVELNVAELPRLFEPFWRRDEARGDRAHVGLGLAVVRTVVRSFGFEVAADLRGDRLRLTVRRSGPGGSPRA